jgi:hypothetical protein
MGRWRCSSTHSQRRQYMAVKEVHWPGTCPPALYLLLANGSGSSVGIEHSLGALESRKTFRPCLELNHYSTVVQHYRVSYPESCAIEQSSSNLPNAIINSVLRLTVLMSCVIKHSHEKSHQIMLVNGHSLYPQLSQPLDT